MLELLKTKTVFSGKNLRLGLNNLSTVLSLSYQPTRIIIKGIRKLFCPFLIVYTTILKLTTQRNPSEELFFRTFVNGTDYVACFLSTCLALLDSDLEYNIRSLEYTSMFLCLLSYLRQILLASEYF